MKYSFIFSLLLIFTSLNCSSQIGGEKVYQFLNLSTSARQIALGGEVLTLTDDVNQPNWNPATINNELDNKIAANYVSFLAGVNIGSVSYARQISRRFGTIHANIKYLDYGNLIGADQQGNETGEFSASDLALSVGYAVNLPWTNLFFGANMKIINSNIDNFNSFGIAAD